jgi:hypothetical protein
MEIVRHWDIVVRKNVTVMRTVLVEVCVLTAMEEVKECVRGFRVRKLPARKLIPAEPVKLVKLVSVEHVSDHVSQILV